MIWDWVNDVRQAVSFLETLPTVRPDRIGVVGMSMGGGVACTAAAVDARLRVVVALAPVADGEWSFRHLWTTSRGDRKSIPESQGRKVGRLRKYL